MTDSVRDEKLTQATKLHQQGKLADAEAIYRQLWDEREEDNLAYLLGTLQLQKGESRQAVHYLAPVAERRPDSADLQNNLGVAYQTVGERVKAMQAFQAAIKANGEYTQAYQNLGRILMEVQDWTRAEPCYRAAAVLLPDDVPTRREWIRCLSMNNQWDEAAEQLQKLMEEQRSNPMLLAELKLQLAYAYAQQKNYDGAIEIFEEQVREYGDSAELQSNLSYLYEHSGRLEKALAAADTAIEYAPDVPEHHNNRGVALRSLHQLKEAESAFARAVQLQPGFTLARFNRGSLQLMQQRYPEGWEHYESRLELIPPPPSVQSLPVWDGSPLQGQTLVVYCDQGFGDALQFARFLPALRERAAGRVLFQTPPELVDLFKLDAELADEIIPETEQPVTADYRFPLQSAGWLLQISADQISSRFPCLPLPETKGKTESPQLRVGLCWRGNASQAQDHVRTAELETWKSLANVDGIEWYSLQVDATDAELASWPGGLNDLGRGCSTFLETAKRLQQLDLLITVDTALCHLAGGLNFPTWTVLPHTPDWRWHLDGDKTVWYPGMKLYRQQAWGDWDSALAAIAEDLNQRAGND